MASLKAIRRRIATAKSTQQITRALKLVSAARLRRAQEALTNALPYSEALARVADSLLTSEGVSVGPVEGAQKRSLLVVVGSDRGLAGGYNSFVLRAAEDTQREIRSRGLEIELFAVGKKAVDHFKRTGVPIAISRVDNLPRLATIALARDIAAKMLADYRSGAIDEAGIVYTHFKSAISQKPIYERLLPVKPPQTLAETVSIAPVDIRQPALDKCDPALVVAVELKRGQQQRNHATEQEDGREEPQEHAVAKAAQRSAQRAERVENHIPPRMP